MAYGKYPAEILSDRLAFNAYAVRTGPIRIPGKKRRERVSMVVAASNLTAPDECEVESAIS